MSSRKKSARPTPDRDVVDSLVAAAESAVASPAGAPVKVTALAAAAIALTARDHVLTPEQEEQLKTRLQYRLYQRNHRAKKQRRVEELEGDIAALREEIATLDATKQTIQRRLALETIGNFVSAFRSAGQGAQDEKEHALRQLLALDDTRVEWVTQQWRSLSDSFREWWFEMGDEHVMIVHASEERMTVLSCSTVLKIRATRDQLALEFPACSDEELGALARRSSLDLAGRIALIVEPSTRRVVTMALDLDLITSMRMQLDRPLSEVERLVASSRCLQFLSNIASEPGRHADRPLKGKESRSERTLRDVKQQQNRHDGFFDAR